MSKLNVIFGLISILCLALFFKGRADQHGQLEAQKRLYEEKIEVLEERLRVEAGLRPNEVKTLSASGLLQLMEAGCERISNLANSPLEQIKETKIVEKISKQIEEIGTDAVSTLEAGYQKPGGYEFRRRLLGLIGRIDSGAGYRLAEQSLLREGENINIRWASASVMKDLDKERAAKTLTQFLLDHDGKGHPGMSFLIEPLKEIGGYEIQKAFLQAALDIDKDISVRYASIAALGDLHAKEAVPHLRQMVENVPGGYLRIHAARALILIDLKENCEYLKDIQKNEPDPGFKTFLDQLLSDRCR